MNVQSDLCTHESSVSNLAGLVTPWTPPSQVTTEPTVYTFSSDQADAKADWGGLFCTSSIYPAGVAFYIIYLIKFKTENVNI